ncbi:DUF5696 domain-containing protein [Paenibacillus thailandensis]|uniref:DUF5696 domain-containing protein n=1 Tax=Paenibacillus thailandensis TaxID=393250 RepID=A0ABW5QT97_9BACL
MTRRKRLTAVAAGAAALLCVAAGALWLANRGAPAVNASEFVTQTPSTADARELEFLPDSSEGVPGMELVAENAKLSLYYDPETTEIAVRDNGSGHVWRSNPADRQEDAASSPYEKEVLSSQLTITFRDGAGTLETYPNFTRSIAGKQFKAESLNGGIRITYTLGDTSLGIEALPKLIGKRRLEEKVLSKLDESTAKYVSARYYPSSGNPDVLERLDGQIEKQLVLNKMLAAFEKAGYTPEDLAYDNAENGIGAGGGSQKPSFVIPVEYRLEEDSLAVTVPLSQAEESAGYKLRSLDLLAYFGAAGTEEQGYMLVPDGSGSLIRLNNGKVKEEQYVQRVYGSDPNDNSVSRGQVTEDARMPVFGLKSGDRAWFAVIEEGDAIASVTADISGKQNSYNHVFGSFALRGEDELELYTGSELQEIQLLNDRLYEGDLRVRYSFLSGERATYSGMAELYRNMLVKQHGLKPLDAEGGIPFYLDVIGAVEKRKTLLGIPYRSEAAMTTFEQAGEMAERLSRDGVGRVQLRYLGWSAGGVNHKAPVSPKADGGLGGQSGLAQLAERLKQAGGALYPDVAFQRIYRDDGGFVPSSDAARFVTREVARLNPYNRALNRMDSDLGSYYLLSPAKLPYYADRFTERYGRMGLDSVSLRDLGDVLSSDYRDGRVVHRQTAKHIVEEQLERLSADYPDMMAAGGNAYVWPYAKHLVDVPSSSSGFGITDEEVPFYQMAVHGYIEYAGEAMNQSDEQDMRQQLLRAIELGSAPHFLWTHKPSSELKYTPFDTAFSTLYSDWYEEAIVLYKEANEALSPVRSVPMKEHIRLADGIVQVVYENGVSIVVNYTGEPATVDGMTVAARGYAIGGGEHEAG